VSKLTEKDALLFIETVKSLIEAYARLKKIVYDGAGVYFPYEADDPPNIEIVYERYTCGDTDTVDSFDITPKMMSNSEKAILKLIEGQKQGRAERLKEETRLAKVQKEERAEKAKKLEFELYQRLDKKYGGKK